MQLISKWKLMILTWMDCSWAGKYSLSVSESKTYAWYLHFFSSSPNVSLGLGQPSGRVTGLTPMVPTVLASSNILKNMNFWQTEDFSWTGATSPRFKSLYWYSSTKTVRSFPIAVTLYSSWAKMLFYKLFSSFKIDGATNYLSRQAGWEG